MGEKGFVVMTIEILMIVGFCLAAYSIVGNDVPQTLGTFECSSSVVVTLALYQQYFKRSFVLRLVGVWSRGRILWSS